MPDGGYEVTLTGGPMPFARWNCHGCGAGSGTVYRPAGDEGTPVREQAYEHMRRTGHAAYLERGTREELDTMATTVAVTQEAHRRTHTLADPVDDCVWCQRPAEGTEAWCDQTAALGAHRIRYEAGEWMRCDNGAAPLSSVCRSGDDEPTPHLPAPTTPDGSTDWAGEASRLGRRLGRHVGHGARRLQLGDLPLPPPPAQHQLPPIQAGAGDVHPWFPGPPLPAAGTSAAEALQLYAATEPLFDCGYPHGDPGPAGHQSAAAIMGHARLEADLEAAARDRHDRTHTTAGPTPGCPWCAMAQAGDDNA